MARAFAATGSPTLVIDSAAIFQVSETGGLLVLNGAAGTAGDATLTVDNPTTGAITLVLKAAAAVLLTPGYIVWDVELVTASAVTTLVEGAGSVTGDVTRAVS